MTLKWEHIDNWRTFSRTFAIEVSRHNKYPEGNGWSIYVYIYRSHPLFSKIIGTPHYEDAITDMPLHGGPTFFHYHYDRDKIGSIQVGCDYSHYGDAYFAKNQTKDEAVVQFDDAAILYDWMETYGRD
jgi:hypothetical protein